MELHTFVFAYGYCSENVLSLMICGFGFRTRTWDALVLLLLDIIEGFCYIEIRTAF
jgi:hypothetical protein